MRKLLIFVLVTSFAASCSSSKQTTATSTPSSDPAAANNVSPQPQQTISTANQSTSKTEVRYQR